MATTQNGITSAAQRSGTHWIRRFSGSTLLRDLSGTFRGKAEAFIDALRTAGASVTIAATYRPPQRAYLMHWAWRIAKRNYDPTAVPPMEGLDIAWVHVDAQGEYSREASIAAARAMVCGFDIQTLGVAPALRSRHTMGYGIDMKIDWVGTLTIPDAYGNLIRVGTLPRTGMNLQLKRIGESYGIIKYNRAGRDEPHWSDNGA